MALVHCTMSVGSAHYGACTCGYCILIARH